MKWWRIGLTVALLGVLVLVVSILPASADSSNVAPEGWCAGGTPWIVRGQVSLTDPKCAAGTFVLHIENKDSRFSVFADAEVYRSGQDATLWFEPAATSAPTATATPVVAAATRAATVEFESVSAEVSLTWQNFCSGISPIVLTGGGVLNIGLDDPTPPCDGTGTMVLIEPWRIGCGEDTLHNPNCNVGKQWKFSVWADLVDWMVAGRWTEGSVWFRPAAWSPLDETTITPTPTVSESAETADDEVTGEVSWLRQMLELIQMRLAQLLGPSG